MKIFEILESLRIEQPNPALGICANFDKSNGTDDIEQWLADDDLMSNAMEKWPGFSGNSLFPVPDPDRIMTSGDVFQLHSESVTMWSGSEYALKRIELLEFLIAHFRELDK
ncbi:hypothetical protein [Pseudomonas phage Astolliot]|nr:hypothetical protein [Pseudomonas phage Astolliot]